MSSSRRFWRHTGLLAAIGTVIAVCLASAFLSIGHSPQPRDVPIAVVGPPAAAQQVAAQAPDELSTRSVPDLAAAEAAIRERDVYGAIVPGQQGVRELLIATAANNQVANFLRRTLGRATEANVPKIVDARPLPRDDSSGASIGLLVQVLMIAGTVGVVGLTRLLPRFEGDPRRGVVPLLFLLVYGLLLGFLVAAIAAAFGVGTDASFLDRVLALAFISVAVTLSTGALVALIGPAGSAVAGLLYFVLGSQISGAGTAPEFLPSFWSELGQHLPTGAGATLLRDVFYFPEASIGEPIAILGVYAGVGLIVVIALNLLIARRRDRAAGQVGVAGDTGAVSAA